MAGDRHFILLTSHRSGSTWLADVLNQLPATSVYSELFLPPAEKVKANKPSFQLQRQTKSYLDGSIRSYPHYHYAQVRRSRLRPFSVYRYLRELYALNGRVGFKLMYGQLASFPEIWPYVMARGISTVHLVRENVLDIVISHEVRAKTKIAHTIAGERSNLPVVQIELDPQTTLARMRSLQRNVKWARRMLDITGVRHIDVIYENLRQDPANFLPIFDFVGADAQEKPPESKLVKLVTADYPQLIQNYSELEQCLRGTEFASLLAAKGKP